MTRNDFLGQHKMTFSFNKAEKSNHDIREEIIV